MKKVKTLYAVGSVLAIVGAAITIVCLSIFGSVEPVSVGSFIGIIIGIIIAVIGVFVFKKGSAESKKYCSKCKQPMYGCAYEYRSTRAYDKRNSQTKELEKRLEDVRVTATCPHCGEKKEFVKTFCLYNYKTGESRDIQTAIDDYCEKTFRE